MGLKTGESKKTWGRIPVTGRGQKGEVGSEINSVKEWRRKRGGRIGEKVIKS